jgi:sugar fermentation stimulation protein A
MSNAVARRLLESGSIPGLEFARVVRSEVSYGGNRFDFLMEEGGATFFLEVKSVTLFGNGAALFPDAVTARGRRHLLELAQSAREGKLESPLKPTVLFLIHTDRVDRFLPDYHTDPGFARTFFELREELRYLPVSISWNSSLHMSSKPRLVAIPWDFLGRQLADRGAYLLLLRLDAWQQIQVGKLGQCDFHPGWYVYAGSAMKNLSARMARHMRKRKHFHWHIDYLRNIAAECRVVPIRSNRRQECAVAGAVAKELSLCCEGFGCSDCSCPTHLSYSLENPLNSRRFHDLLEPFRMPVISAH